MSSLNLHNTKPLVRWTVGNVHEQGLHTLKESITRTTKALGVDRFDWMVCHNNTPEEDLEYLRRWFPRIILHKQDWRDCAIPNTEGSPRAEDGSLRTNIESCGGTLWKITPARMRVNAYEIVMDNDVVVCRLPDVVEKFLNDDRPLLCEDSLRFLGCYDNLFPAGCCYNSGFFGLPPGYDFGSALRSAWEEHGSVDNLSYADEQGLICYVLKQSNPHILTMTDVRELHWLGVCYYYYSSECFADYDFSLYDRFYHFVQVNRHAPHRMWCKYKNGVIKFI